MKPLLRYTIGQVSKSGWAVLHESVRLMKKVYPEFDIAICHNGMTPEQVERLTQFEVDLVRQDKLTPCFPCGDEDGIRNFYWKLIPARLRPESHELWIDNDIVITDRIKKIDDWLVGSTGLIGTGFNRDYGRFAKTMPDVTLAYCAGMFGLPPGFDLETKIVEVVGNRTITGFDEQGLVVRIVTGIDNFLTLEQKDMALLSERWRPKVMRGFPHGLHFARVNRFDFHHSWRAYRFVVMP